MSADSPRRIVSDGWRINAALLFADGSPRIRDRRASRSVKERVRVRRQRIDEIWKVQSRGGVAYRHLMEEVRVDHPAPTTAKKIIVYDDKSGSRIAGKLLCYRIDRVVLNSFRNIQTNEYFLIVIDDPIDPGRV